MWSFFQNSWIGWDIFTEKQALELLAALPEAAFIMAEEKLNTKKGPVFHFKASVDQLTCGFSFLNVLF